MTNKIASPANYVGLNGLAFGAVGEDAIPVSEDNPLPVALQGGGLGNDDDAPAASYASVGTLIAHIKHLSQLVSDVTTPAPVFSDVRLVDVVLTLDTNIYASGDVLAATQVVSGCMRAIDVCGVLHSVTVIDKDNQKDAMALFIFDANVALGPENATASITDSDAAHVCGPPILIAAADYADEGGVSIAGKEGLNKIVKPIAGTDSIGIAARLTAGTPTHTATGIVLRLGFLN